MSVLEHVDGAYLKILSATNATKCYGSYGCFELSPPWTSETRPVSFFPEELEKVNNCFVYSLSSVFRPL